jgi:hypothetical protein
MEVMLDIPDELRKDGTAFSGLSFDFLLRLGFTLPA